MLQEHYFNVHCSISIFAVCSWSIVHSNMLLEHIYYMLLEHCTFRYAPGANLTENITPDYLCYNLGPKSHRSMPPPHMSNEFCEKEIHLIIILLHKLAQMSGCIFMQFQMHKFDNYVACVNRSPSSFIIQF